MAREVNKKEAQEGEIVESYWDFKKISIGLAVVALFIIAGGYLATVIAPKNNVSNNVLGTSEAKISEVPPLPDKEDIEGIISRARESLSQITSENLTSSQAAIQKVISDLEGLQKKNGAVGVFCSLVCKDK